MWKNLLISLGYFFGIMLVLTFIITVFDYFNILSNNISSIIRFLILIISILVSSFILGNKSIKKGYINGIKLGIVIVILFFIISNIFGSFNFSSLIYYFIIVLTSSIGSMLGINKKKATN